MYNGKIAWIENAVDATVKTTYNPTDTSKWAGHITYKASQKNDGKWHKVATKTLQSSTTYGASPSVVRYTDRQYSAKKTISGKKRQYYRSRYRYHIKGFLSGLKDGVLTGYDKNKNKYYCKGFAHESEGKGEIPRPTSCDVSFTDVDAYKVKENGKTTIATGVTFSGVKQYAKRHRTRKNVVTLTVSWSYLTPEEASKIIKALTDSTYLRINFLNPASNTYETKTFYNTDRTLQPIALGYRDLTVELKEC